MTATLKGICTQHATLLKEYGVALHMWTEVRAFYQDHAAPEVIAATERVEELEEQLRAHRKVHGC